MSDSDRLELLLYKWQIVSYACINCSKPRGKPWMMRITGLCPITKKEVQKLYQAETLAEVRAALFADPLILSILTDERVTNVLDKLQPQH